MAKDSHYASRQGADHRRGYRAQLWEKNTDVSRRTEWWRLHECGSGLVLLPCEPRSAGGSERRSHHAVQHGV